MRGIVGMVGMVDGPPGKNPREKRRDSPSHADRTAHGARSVPVGPSYDPPWVIGNPLGEESRGWRAARKKPPAGVPAGVSVPGKLPWPGVPVGVIRRSAAPARPTGQRPR